MRHDDGGAARSSAASRERIMCSSDRLWYSCSDPSCEGVRACRSNSGLLHCACPPFDPLSTRPRLTVQNVTAARPPAPRSVFVLQSADRIHASAVYSILEHNRQWAAAHGHQYVLHLHGAQPHASKAKFERYAQLLALLENSSAAASAVAYLDNDAVFSSSGPLPFSPAATGAPILFGNELTVQGEFNRHFNSGFLLIRNTPFARKFLRAVLHDKACAECQLRGCGPHSFYDQGCIDILLRGRFAKHSSNFAITLVQAPRPGRLITHTPGIFRNWTLLHEIAGAHLGR